MQDAKFLSFKSASVDHAIVQTMYRLTKEETPLIFKVIPPDFFFMALVDQSLRDGRGLILNNDSSPQQWMGVAGQLLLDCTDAQKAAIRMIVGMTLKRLHALQALFPQDREISRIEVNTEHPCGMAIMALKGSFGHDPK